MAIKNPASALGEAVGKLIEDNLENILKPVCESYGYLLDREGKRSEKRSGVKLQMVNKSANKYQLDAVIETMTGEPVVLIESKYLRYKKHNRDKASWTCAAHYSLRKSYPTIRKSIAVISGNWSTPSKKFMESFGIELYEIPFDLMCKILKDVRIEFDWHEKDQKIPQQSWDIFLTLLESDKQKIGERLVEPIKNQLIQSIETTLESGEDWAKRLKEIELLLKTDHNEYFVYSFYSVRDAIKLLLNLQEEVPDLSGKL